MTQKVIVVHDVLGTLFGLQTVIDELQGALGDQVKDRRFAELIIMDWYHAAQRDFMMLSVNDAYKPISDVFRASVVRVLRQAGVELDSSIEASICQRLMTSLQTLQARPGMKQAFGQTYKRAGVQTWGATNGGITLAKKLFESVWNNEDDDKNGERVAVLEGPDASDKFQQSSTQSSVRVGLFSCDEIRVAKPDPRVYAEVKRRVLKGQSDDDDDDVRLWFVASHTWDLFAARKAGFKTAWVSYEEFDVCKDLYGEHDIVGHDLDDVARQIVEYEQRR